MIHLTHCKTERQRQRLREMHTFVVYSHVLSRQLQVLALVLCVPRARSSLGTQEVQITRKHTLHVAVNTKSLLCGVLVLQKMVKKTERRRKRRRKGRKGKERKWFSSLLFSSKNFQFQFNSFLFASIWELLCALILKESRTQKAEKAERKKKEEKLKGSFPISSFFIILSSVFFLSSP